MRKFCYALRDWDPLFNETDFKLSDGEASSAMFRTFTLRKVEELVGYGLGGTKPQASSDTQESTWRPSNIINKWNRKIP